MNIGLLGYGRMGHEVEKAANSLGHTICVTFDINDTFSSKSQMNGAEVLIDFTLADGVLDNLKTAAALDIPVVEGTTGWLDKVTSLDKIDNLTVIYSPNFSIGVYQFTKLVRYASQLFAPLTDYDCYLHEWHHTGKADSPSGTAKKLADVMLENLPGKESALYDSSHGRIDPKHLHVTSTRVGRVPGTHEVGFDSEVDYIKLKHEARGRQGFAYGAVHAAEWIAGKSGIYTMDDFMKDISNV